MSTFFERALLPLAQLGAIDILVFFLVFLIVYIFVHKSKVLGPRATKSMEAVIAVATALMFVNIIPGTTFIQYLAWFIVAFVAIIVLLLILSMFGIEQTQTHYIIGGVLGLVLLLVFSQLINSEIVMSLVLAGGILGLVIVAVLALPNYALLAALGGNGVLAVMAITLGFEQSVETVYLNGITMGILVFGGILWYIIRGGEVAGEQQQQERERTTAASRGTTQTAPRAAQREAIRAAAPAIPAREFSRNGALEPEWTRRGDELEQFLEEPPEEYHVEDDI